MSDLISRSELINFLRIENQKCITSTGYELSLGVIATLIECQQTAYDIDKVVEELETMSQLITFKDMFNVHENIKMVATDIATQIVKQGGVGTETETIRDKAIKWNNNSSKRVPYEFIDYVEGKRDIGVSDDVCEWRLCDEEANVYDTSCRNPHILIDGTPKENGYIFCHYCGKKIKVVE